MSKPDPILVELSRSGRVPTPAMPELEELLKQSRVTPQTPLPPMQPLFTIHGEPCFYRGELTADCGKAKSGKTLFLSIVMACTIKQEVLAVRRVGEQPLRLLWIDTEQSKQSTQDIQVNRIMPLTDGIGISDDLFFAYNLRGLGYETRRKLMEAAIQLVRPDLVIIDGIKDLVTDINDAVQATLLMEQIMALAQNNNCCIVNVLHQNKSEADKNMRGSIGTELTNKAFEVFRCEYIEESDTFKVTRALSRKKRVKQKLYYRLDDDGLPMLCDDLNENTGSDNGRHTSSKPKKTVTPEVKWEALNQKYLIATGDTFEWNLPLLFEDAFEGYASRPYSHVMAAALRLSHIEDPKLFYTLFRTAEERSIIRLARHPDSGDAYVELILNALPFN